MKIKVSKIDIINILNEQRFEVRVESKFVCELKSSAIHSLGMFAVSLFCVSSLYLIIALFCTNTKYFLYSHGLERSQRGPRPRDTQHAYHCLAIAVVNSIF